MLLKTVGLTYAGRLRELSQARGHKHRPNGGPTKQTPAYGAVRLQSRARPQDSLAGWQQQLQQKSAHSQSLKLTMQIADTREALALRLSQSFTSFSSRTLPLSLAPSVAAAA